MAITWDVTITPLNVPRKEASVTAVRTDDGPPVKINTYIIMSVILDNGADKAAVLDQLWA